MNTDVRGGRVHTDMGCNQHPQTAWGRSRPRSSLSRGGKAETQSVQGVQWGGWRCRFARSADMMQGRMQGRMQRAGMSAHCDAYRACLAHVLGNEALGSYVVRSSVVR